MLTGIFAIVFVIASLTVTDPEKEDSLPSLEGRSGPAAIAEAPPKEPAAQQAQAQAEGGIQTFEAGWKTKEFWMLCTLMTLFVCKA
jgi:hypothetical protein